ncbi:MAG: alpha-isopropylmalate synthase regulatory domain-containing protein, partial [Oscillospiraceae bacterium]
PNKISIHTHNDRGMAVANSIMGVEGGAIQIQGTYLGYGERCGNATLSTIIPNLQLGMNMDCIPPANVKQITSAARKIAEISNITLKTNEPYVGISAFSHKAGMHSDGVLKLNSSYEHIDPALVGNERKMLTSDISGRTAILEQIKKINPDIEKSSPETTTILKELKKMESFGYQFEGADGSFEMLIRRCLGAYKSFFELKTYKIVSAQPSESGCSATATVKIKVGDKEQLMAAEGNGPINALDKALRSALEVFYPSLRKVRLIDYKVRVIDSTNTTAATVRVLITSTNGKQIWTTIGVSGDVVEASRLALTESIEYELIKSQNT